MAEDRQEGFIRWKPSAWVLSSIAGAPVLPRKGGHNHAQGLLFFLWGGLIRGLLVVVASLASTILEWPLAQRQVGWCVSVERGVAMARR